MPWRDPHLTPARARVGGYEALPIDRGWETAPCSPGSHPDPTALEDLDWLAARVPGTAAGALRDIGAWSDGDARDFDSEDWWFRVRFEAGPAAPDEEVILRLDGIATEAEVFLNGRPLLRSASMFLAHGVDVGSLLAVGENELAIRCLALGPLLAAPRKPRARWRQSLVPGGLRFHRTMLLGRAPGIAPGPAAVGPWRLVWLERRRRIAVELLEAQPGLQGVDGAEGRLTARLALRSLSGPPPSAIEVELAGPSGVHRAALDVSPEGSGAVIASGRIAIPDVAPWLPHTHGEPALHSVRFLVRTAGDEEIVVEAGRTGFRAVSWDPPALSEERFERHGVELRLGDGTALFARGAVWTPPDPVGLAPEEAQLREQLGRVREAGMNMLRVVGTGAYESPGFHNACDELGIMVWQDFMFANLDYPVSDPDFRESVRREAEQALAALAGRPSLTVLCGNSEIEQQVAMLGLDPALGRGELFGELLAEVAARACPSSGYLPSAPCGGALPFRTDRGVANYFGVGGYRRPLEDARRAEVRFASECLAISNLPEAAESYYEDDPKRGVPRDATADWDFEDVRDHYLGLLFGADPAELRRADPGRYLELSRAASGETMAAVFGEWRRAGSPCSGGLILWLRDLAPGAGWGLLDREGRPKAPYHHLRRALAPTAVWMTDEGLDGVDVHVANDGAEPLDARLRVSLYRDFEVPVGEASQSFRLGPRSATSIAVESVIGSFVDASWAYRFGPPAQDLIVAGLERDSADGVETVAQSFHFPAGRPSAVETPAQLGLEARAERRASGAVALSLSTRRLAYGVRVHAGWVCEDNCFSVAPSATRTIVLVADGAEENPELRLTALNMKGSVVVSPAG